MTRMNRLISYNIRINFYCSMNFSTSSSFPSVTCIVVSCVIRWNLRKKCFCEFISLAQCNECCNFRFIRIYGHLCSGFVFEENSMIIFEKNCKLLDCRMPVMNSKPQNMPKCFIGADISMTYILRNFILYIYFLKWKHGCIRSIIYVFAYILNRFHIAAKFDIYLCLECLWE